MRQTVLKCDKSRLSIAIFPYQNLLEYCDDCANIMEMVIEKAMAGDYDDEFKQSKEVK